MAQPGGPKELQPLFRKAILRKFNPKIQACKRILFVRKREMKELNNLMLQTDFKILAITVFDGI